MPPVAAGKAKTSAKRPAASNGAVEHRSGDGRGKADQAKR